jgi:dolichol-phosphate mannosyltransferase
MTNETATVVVLPTYDERQNIQAIVPAILDAAPDVQVWIVDDNSPDGTGDLADALAASDARIRTFHRPAKAGLGTAYIESFHRALAEGYDFVVEIDADFSHDPGILPDLLRAAQTSDLVLGSRYVPGGSTPDWTLPRRIISHVGNVVARSVLGLPVHDSTTGYRVFNRRALQNLQLEGIRLQGYGFQIETVYQTHRSGLVISEYPICFRDRRQGQSKMSRGIVVEALLYVFRRRFSEISRRLPSNQPYEIRDYHGPSKHANNGHDGVQPQAPAQAEVPVDQLE